MLFTQIKYHSIKTDKMSECFLLFLEILVGNSLNLQY